MAGAAIIAAASPLFMSAAAAARRSDRRPAPPRSGGCAPRGAGSPSVTTSVWPSSSSARPLPSLAEHASDVGAPGATARGPRPRSLSFASQRSTWAATAASVACRIAGLHHAGDADEVAGERDQLTLVDLRDSTCATDVRASAHGGDYSLREGQDDRVETDDAVLLVRDVEVVTLDLLGALLECDHGSSRPGISRKALAPSSNPSPARDDLAVADRRALRAVHAYHWSSAGLSASSRTSRLMP